jgi:hypothetical protein
LKNASKMSLVWSGKGNYFIVRLLIPLMWKNIRKIAKSELTRFKNLVEIYGHDFNI